MPALIVKDIATSKKLSKTVESTGALIFYKMNGCGHCVFFEENVWKKCPPKMAKMAAEVELNNIPLLHQSLKFVNNAPIMGFPTIAFKHGKADEEVFNGDRTIEALTEFFNRSALKYKPKKAAASKAKKA